jgi:hypothetical protein
MKQLYLYIPIVVIAMITSGVEATAQTTSTPPPQYFTLSLPAGVSLVSAPLNTGQTVAQGQFQGLHGCRKPLPEKAARVIPGAPGQTASSRWCHPMDHDPSEPVVDWQRALVIVQPDTLIRWNRKGFRFPKRRLDHSSRQNVPDGMPPSDSQSSAHRFRARSQGRPAIPGAGGADLPAGMPLREVEQVRIAQMRCNCRDSGILTQRGRHTISPTAAHTHLRSAKPTDQWRHHRATRNPTPANKAM